MPASASRWSIVAWESWTQGLEWMEKGVDERDLLLVTALKTEPSYDPLRSHPAYQALLRKMNLEP